MKRFRRGLVCKAHRLFVSINSRLESSKEEKRRRRNRLSLEHVPDVPVRCRMLNVQSLGSGFQGLWFRVSGLVFRVQGLGLVFCVKC